jgi:hypothetical protein
MEKQDPTTIGDDDDQPLEREASDEVGEKQDDTGSIEPDARESAPQQSFWQRHNGQIIAAVVGAAALLVIPPTASWLLGAADAVRDVGRVFVVGWDAAKLDDFKERVEDRPYWVGEPTTLDESLDWVQEHGGTSDEPIGILSGNEPERRSVGYVLDTGADNDGEPFVLVGKVLDDDTLVPGADSADHGSSEIVLGSSEGPLTVGEGSGYIGSGFSASEGDAVAFLGVLVAIGRVEDPENEAGIDSGYFLALHEASTGRSRERGGSGSGSGSGAPPGLFPF